MNEVQEGQKYILYRKISIHFIYTILITLFVALLIWKPWNNYKDLMHSMIEYVSVVIGVATFLIIWYQNETDGSINKILGFGFLATAFFDFMHIHYYKYYILNSSFNGDITARYWIMARLTEIASLLVFSYFPFSKKGNKYVMMVITSITTTALICMLSVYQMHYPILYTNEGFTTARHILESLVIVVALIILYKLKNNLENKQMIRFVYLFLCVVMIIPSELCFILYRDITSFPVVWGHILKVASYYYLYKAVFESAIRYPYAKLRENNQRLSDILNAIPMPIHTYDNNNCIDFVNERFVELLRYPKEKVIGLNDIEALSILPKVGCDDKATIPHKINKNKGKTVNVINTYLNGNNEQIKVLVNAQKIKNGILVLMNDIKQEQEIKNLHLQTETILNAITVPMMILDAKGSITACNNAASDLLEISCKDIIGISKYKFDDILKFEQKELTDISGDKQTRNVINEGYIETPLGNKKELRILCSKIHNIDNEGIGTIYVLQDVTQEKEKQLKLINQEKLALLGQMGATIVHETRNFLTTIKGSSQLIEVYSNDTKIKQYAKKISINTDEVNRIITDFLNLSKPRETELLEVGFNDLVLSMKGILETSSLMEKVELILDLDYDERYILCDETQIKQVILNICKNAVEAMNEKKKPILQINTGLREDANETFIKISDNGKGISKEIINKIGTPFFTTKKNGTGLGLNACYQIINDHNGKLEIESQMGKGTSFTIILPFINDEIDDLT